MTDHKAAKKYAANCPETTYPSVINLATCYLERDALVLEEIKAQTGLWGPERLSPAMRKSCAR